MLMQRIFPATVLAAALSLALASSAAAQSAPAVEVPNINRPDGESADWWFINGAAQAAERGAMQGKARNVILFLGDGMSLTTVAAARILEGQRQGRPGEEQRLSWEDFPATALSRTYNTNAQTPDSAGTMSAIATGVKTRMGVVSIGQDAPRNDCAAALKSPMLTLWQLAAASGMKTGVVSTTRLTHATPAATFSHSPNRNWETDTDLPAHARDAGCIDIARQMVETNHGNGPDVMLGGGRRSFMPDTQTDPEYPEQKGRRKDGRDLIATWKARHPGGVYVWNLEQLNNAPANAPIMGLFEPSHMQYEHDRPNDQAGEPSLAEMTRAAISRLSQHKEGYVLLIEGGRIDHAHHAGNAYRALADTVAMSDAVRVAAEMTSADDTLIVVTADHSHTLHFVGYPRRGNPIMGKVSGASWEEGASEHARDGMGLPYTTLVYANGPGYAGANESSPEGPKFLKGMNREWKQATQGRPDLTDVDTEHPDYLQEAMVPMTSETHGGDDVGVWARGPGSQAFRGNLEQNSLFHLMLQATPRLRQALCDSGHCNAVGIPVKRPDPAQFRDGVKR